MEAFHTAHSARVLRRRQAGVAGLLAATLVCAGLVNPAFAGLTNLRDMLVQCVPGLIIGCGVTLVVLVGEIDISVGSLTGLLAAVMGILASPQRMGCPVIVAVLATLSVGAGIGLINGLLVTVGRVPSILATLGMLTALRGATEQLLRGEWITELPPSLHVLGIGAWLGVPISLWAAGACVALTALLARRTTTGRRLYGVGDNLEAARLAGLPVARLKVLTFALTGLLTGVAALVSVPQLSVIEAGQGEGLELVVVTAVVVGGTSIRGGVATLTGTVLAVILLGSFRTVLVFLKLGDSAIYWERAIQGMFILGAVVIEHAPRLRRFGRVPQASMAEAGA